MIVEAIMGMRGRPKSETEQGNENNGIHFDGEVVVDGRKEQGVRKLKGFSFIGKEQGEGEKRN